MDAILSELSPHYVACLRNELCEKKTFIDEKPLLHPALSLRRCTSCPSVLEADAASCHGWPSTPPSACLRNLGFGSSGGSGASTAASTADPEEQEEASSVSAASPRAEAFQALVDRARRVQWIPYTSGEQGLRCSYDVSRGVGCVDWTVSSKRLTVKDRRIVSPVVNVAAASGNGRSLLLKMVLNAKEVHSGRGGAAFKSSRKGSIMLRCDSDELSEEDALPGSAEVAYRVSLVGDSSVAAPVIRHDFAEAAMARGHGEEFDFGAATDEASKVFVVRLELFEIEVAVEGQGAW